MSSCWGLFLWKNFSPAKHTPTTRVASPSRGYIKKGRGGWKFVVALGAVLLTDATQSDLALSARLG